MDVNYAEFRTTMPVITKHELLLDPILGFVERFTLQYASVSVLHTPL